jgi:hypothetical protein
MKWLITTILLATGIQLLIGSYIRAQELPSAFKLIDVDGAIGNTEGTLAVSFNLDKNLGKKHRIVAGLGARFTSYLGKNQYYITAPAELTSGSTGPGVIFKENIDANIDTVLIKTAQVNSLNLLVTLGYNVSSKLLLRFNIDVIGFSFGKRANGNYINGSQGAMESSDPAPFNLLLISDNDKGSLNSEFFARYFVNDRWGVKGGLQFHFTEYTTDTEVQQQPAPNDRFRNKSLMFMAGVSFKL